MAEIATTNTACQHSLTVIFLHGFSMTAVDMAEDMATLFLRFPEVRFVFPQAPSRVVTACPSYGECPTWYDYFTDYNGTREDEADTRSVRDSRAALLRLLWREKAKGVPVVMGGLSQGGCMALDVAAHSGDLLAVITCVSHRLHSSRIRPLACPWWALSAENDDIFPSSWSKPRKGEAKVHQIKSGADHYLSGGECHHFVGEVLDTILNETSTERKVHRTK
jgi:predicted esterase